MSVSLYGSGQTVLQVVFAQNNTATSTSSSTYINSGLTATITPQSTTSKILIIVNMTDVERQSSASTYGTFQITRNGTSVLVFCKEGGYVAAAGSSLSFAEGATYLDSPATTSATTYTIQFASQTNTAAIQLNASGAYSTLTLMEISGS